MAKLSNKRYVLVNLPGSISEEDISSLFEDIKPLRKVIIENNPKAKFSKRFAHLLLNEVVQPYYVPTFFEKIRQAKLSGHPLVMFPVFLNQPAEVNRLFDHICRLIGTDDFVDQQKAEAITNELAKIDKKLRQAGLEPTLQVLSKVSDQGKIDLTIAETQITEAATRKLAEIRQKSKTSKKKKKKNKKNSVIIISTPMGGQPGWKRK